MKNIRTTLSLAILATLVLASFSNCTEDKPAWKHDDNTLRVRQPASIKTLNPYLFRTRYERNAFELIFQNLMNFDYAKLELAPQLIKAAPVVQDITSGEHTGGQSFTYEIFAEAAWDDGKPVTGKDYEFTLKALFNPKMPTQRFLPYVEFVKDIELDSANPKLFTIFTSQKYFLNMEAISSLPVLPEHVYDAEGLMKNFTLKDLTDPAKATALAADARLQQFADAYTSPRFSREVVSGCGPYKLVEWVDDQRVVLAKKENWWGTKLADQYPLLQAYPDTIVFLPIEDGVAAVAAIKDESVDVANELDSKQFNELRQVDFVQKIFNFSTPPTYTYFYSALNNRNPKLADKRVRRALAHVLDMDMVIRDIYDGLGEQVAGPFSPDKKYYDTSLKPIAMNLDEARKLLDAAGWKDSNGNGILDKTIDGNLTELKLQYLFTTGNSFSENLTQVFKTNAQKVGIEIERVPVESNVMGEKLRNGDYEIASRGAGAQPVPDDPKQLWHTDGAQPGGSNYARFGNAASDALIESIRNAPDEATRTKLYKDFQQLIYDEQPVIFLLSPMEKLVIHQRFEPVVGRLGLSLQHLKLKK